MVSFKTLKLCTELGCKVGKAKPPKFNIGTVTKPIDNVVSHVEHTAPSFIIGAKRAEQATHKMTGATQLAELNRAFHIGPKLITGTPPPRLVSKDSFEPLSNIEAFCKDFKKRTKELGLELELHIPDNWDLSGMTYITDVIEAGIKNGTIPKDIEHVVMGHGVGLSKEGTWVFAKSGQSVPNWISENIKPGKKCIVAVCEFGNAPINKDQPAIGSMVSNLFTNPSQPAKIMQSGNNNIIGHYLLNDGVKYYELPKTP